MPYAKPKAGQEIAPWLESAQFIGDIVQVVNAFKLGELGGQPAETQRQIWIENTSGSNRTSGEILQIDAMTQPAAAIVEGFFQSPTMTAINPVWHTAIDNLAVVHSAVLNAQMMSYQPRRWAMVLVTVMVATDQYVMIDPATPHRLKTSDAGIWKILGLDTTNNRAVIDMTQSQNLWGYELKEASNAPFATSAKLMRLDGTQFAPTISLLDPLSLMEDQLTADTGFCFHVGNNFYAIQAPC